MWDDVPTPVGTRYVLTAETNPKALICLTSEGPTELDVALT